MLGESSYLRDEQILNFAYYMPLFDFFSLQLYSVPYGPLTIIYHGPKNSYFTIIQIFLWIFTCRLQMLYKKLFGIVDARLYAFCRK